MEMFYGTMYSDLWSMIKAEVVHASESEISNANRASQFPYQVAVLQQGRYICSGTFVHFIFVITVNYDPLLFCTI